MFHGICAVIFVPAIVFRCSFEWKKIWSEISVNITNIPRNSWQILLVHTKKRAGVKARRFCVCWILLWNHWCHRIRLWALCVNKRSEIFIHFFLLFLEYCCTWCEEGDRRDGTIQPQGVKYWKHNFDDFLCELYLLRYRYRFVNMQLYFAYIDTLNKRITVGVVVG